MSIDLLKEATATAILALVEDTEIKLNDEENEHDTQYLIEDLTARLRTLAVLLDGRGLADVTVAMPAYEIETDQEDAYRQAGRTICEVIESCSR